MLSETEKITNYASGERRYSIDLEYGDSVKVRKSKFTSVLSRQNCKRALYALGATILLITAFCYGSSYLTNSEQCRRRMPAQCHICLGTKLVGRWKDTCETCSGTGELAVPEAAKVLDGLFAWKQQYDPKWTENVRRPAAEQKLPSADQLTKFMKSRGQSGARLYADANKYLEIIKKAGVDHDAFIKSEMQIEITIEHDRNSDPWKIFFSKRPEQELKNFERVELNNMIAVPVHVPCYIKFNIPSAHCLRDKSGNEITEMLITEMKNIPVQLIKNPRRRFNAGQNEMHVGAGFLLKADPKYLLEKFV